MKKPILLLFLFSFGMLFSQTDPKLSPTGFAAVELSTPKIPMQNIMESAKAWASYYNNKGADVYEVTENSLKIDAVKENAFFYRNVGEKYVFKIKYSLAVVFSDTKYKLTFSIKEIYGKDNKRIESTIADYFTSEGKLKEGFEEVKPSLEYTANIIITSFSDYIAR